MKRTKHRTKTFFLCIFLLSGLSQLTSCNIITNGGFEESFLSANEELQTSPTAAQDSQIREISFSEYEWIVRNSYGNAQGPGPNFFNNSEENVWVDNAGALHLKIREYNGTWYCSEVYSKETFGYGTYVFKVGDEFQNIDKNIIVGLFTYLNDENEIDIEFTQWGYEDNENAQYVCQPYFNEGNTHRFNLKDIQGASFHSFTWCERYIHFVSSTSESIETFSSQLNNSDFGTDLREKWTYEGNDVPETSTERVHMNFWLMDGSPPSDGQEYEITIEEFKFIPSECNKEIDQEIAGFAPVILSISGITMVISLVKSKKKSKKMRSPI